jgi:ELWxxDGT repeat protein
MQRRTHRVVTIAAAVAAAIASLGALAGPSAAAVFRVTAGGTDNSLSAGLGTLVWTHDYDVVAFTDSPQHGYVKLLSGFDTGFQAAAQAGPNFYFSSMNSLWKSDGTAAGTAEVATLPDGSTRTVTSLTDLNGSLFFRGYTPGAGYEPWVSDGTGPGTALVRDVFAGPGHGYYYGDRAVVGVGAYFNGDDGTSGEELWVSNGTEGGTFMVRDINGGAGGSAPASFVACGPHVYFVATDGSFGRELWRTDGSGGGTLMVADVRSGADGANPYELTCVGTRVFFLSSSAATQQDELWVYDPASGPHLLKDDWGCEPYSPSCGPRDGTFKAAGGLLFFAAGDGISGVELWKSDGTPAGTAMVKDLWPGLDYRTGTPFPNSSEPFAMEEKDGKLYFKASHPDFGNEIWVSDGTAANTWPITDVLPGPKGSWPDQLTSAGSHLFFRVTGDGSYNVWGFDPADTPPYRDVARDGSFEGAATGANWSLLGLKPLLDKRVCNERSYERCSFKMTGSATAAKGLRQTLVSNGVDLGAAGQVFSLSGWSKAIGASAAGGFYGLEVVVNYSDGTTQSGRVSFTRATHRWQYKRVALAAAKSWSRVTIAARYLNQAGTAWFDDLRLTVR